MINLIKSEKCFQALLRALSAEYTVICDAIDTQKNLNINMSLQKLQKKKAQLKTLKTALWAKP